MIDMIRKHTVEGTGNWRTIVAMVQRSQEMLRMAKDATRSFVCLFYPTQRNLRLTL